MTLEQELAAMRRWTVSQLRTRYTELFGDAPRCRHRLWLLRRIAWRRQALAEGGLSERAQRRAQELANEADLRIMAPSAARAAAPATAGRAAATAKRRLPMPGTVLTRRYKDRTLAVTVLTDGFEFEGQRYKSLSAVAKLVTGAHWNGFHFFGLVTKERQP